MNFKLSLKLGEKKFKFTVTKRDVKIWDVNGEAVMKEWNSDELEPELSVNGKKLIYRAEFWNGIVEHLNTADVKVAFELPKD